MRNMSWLVGILICGPAFGAMPEEVEIERGDCSRAFVLGELPVVKEAAIYKEPRKNSALVLTLRPGTTVTASICEWRRVPGIAQIVGEPYKTTKDLDRGKPVYIFENYEGGRARVFQNGTFYITKIATKKGQCEDRDDPHRCWAKVLREPQFFTWVRVKVSGANIGWTLLGDGGVAVKPLPGANENTH